MMIRQLCVIWWGLWAGAVAAAEPRYELLVAGSLSDNVVAFDLQTNSDRVIAKLANGSRPRALAVSTAGEIVVGLRGNRTHLIKLVPPKPRRSGKILVAQAISLGIGRYGPGMIAADPRGGVLVGGDDQRHIIRIAMADIGALTTTIPARRANTFGLTVHENTLYVSEYFQGNILRFDLTADPPTPQVLIRQSEHLDRPCGLAIGHNGHLFIASMRNDFIQEFDARTGRFVGTFLNVNYLGTSGVHDLQYDPRVGRYFLSSGDAVFEIERDGSLRNRYESPALKGARGIACRLVVED